MLVPRLGWSDVAGQCIVCNRATPAQPLKKRSTVVKGCSIARLYLQSPSIVCHCVIVPPQTVVREGTIVERSAVAGVELDCSTVVLESIFKSSLHLCDTYLAQTVQTSLKHSKVMQVYAG